MGSLQAGQKVLHFRIERKLGEGGMGEVYCAEDSKLGRRVAVKVLPWQIRRSEKARQRFFLEARSASLLNHSNIVTIYSIEETVDLDLIVMEYVEGETLSSILAGGPLEVSAISNFGEQIAEALSAAHSAGIIHRDIKSSNILITSRGKVKVLDFGLAKIAKQTSEEMLTRTGEPASLTESGAILGTVAYMSPEQVLGSSVDAQSDLFSFGSVLYEAATGRLPFLGPNIAAIMFQIATSEPPIPSSLRSDLPVELDRIILRALAKDKEQRFQSAHEIFRALQKFKQLPTQELQPLPADETPIATSSTEDVLVGRETELIRLKEVLSQTKNGKGRVMLIKGQAGIGKTSLMNHFVHLVSKNHPQLIVARGQCVESYGTGEAYLPLLDAVGSLLTSNLKNRVVSILRSNAPTWYLQFPSAFDSTDTVRRSEQESIGLTKERMLRELSDALTSLSSFSHLILVLEDLHWADPSTVDFLRYLSHRISRLKILLLASCRDEEVEAKNSLLRACLLELKAHRLSEEIDLNALQQQDVQEYIDQSYPGNQFSEEFVHLIYRKTEGHPLFVTSLLQFLMEQGILLKNDTGWVLTRPMGEMDLELPESVKSMIRKNIEALSEEEKRFLQYASVQGDEFLTSILAVHLEKEDLIIEEEVRSIAKRVRIIRQIGEEELPDGTLVTRYRFSHALYQNVLSEDLVSSRRVLLHRQTAEQLFRHYGDQAPRIAGKLAVHFKTGREFQKAFEYFTLAGDNAKNLFANMEAASLYKNALQQIEKWLQANSREMARWNDAILSVHEKLGDVLMLAGFQQEARGEFQKARDKNSGERLVNGRLRRKIAKAWETERRLEEAVQEYETAEQLLSEDAENSSIETRREMIQVYLDRFWLHYTRNDLAKLQLTAERIKTTIEAYGTPQQQSQFFITDLLTAYRRNRYWITEEVLQIAAKALKAALESGNPHQIADTTFTNGFANLWAGNFEIARDKIEDALQKAEKTGDAVLQSRCLIYLTVAYRKMENIQKVRDLIPRCFEHCAAIKMDEYIAATHANLAWVYLREGKEQEALTEAETAVRIWTSLPIVSPFQDLARWPILSIIQNDADLSPAIAHLRYMLDPAQHRLSDELTEAMQKTIAAFETNRLQDCRTALIQTLNLAQRDNHF